MNTIDGVFSMLFGVFVPLMAFALWLGSEVDYQTSLQYRPDTPEEAQISTGCGWFILGCSLVIGVALFSHGLFLISNLPTYLSFLAIVVILAGIGIFLRRGKDTVTQEKMKEKKGFIRLSDGQIAEVIEDDVVVPSKAKRQ